MYRVRFEGTTVTIEIERKEDYDFFVIAGAPLFMHNRMEHRGQHDRETCFRETMEELQARYLEGETETRRSSGLDT